MSKPPAPSDLADKFMLRMPEGLRERIKAAAEANNRSMNAEIVSTLEEKYPTPLTDKELNIITHFRETIAKFETGNKRKDDRIAEVVSSEYIELMKRISEIRMENLSTGEVWEDFYRRVSQALAAKGLLKKP